MTSSQQSLETSHGTVEYLDVGAGTPVLYFHGTGAGNEAALLLEQSLLQSDCRLIILNRPGYGATTLGKRGSAKFVAGLAADVLDHLAINRAVVIGTSGGGMSAACFARCYANRTAALILQCAESHRWDEGKWLPTGLERTLFLFRHSIFAPLLRWQNMRHAKASCRRPITYLQHMSGGRFPEIRDDLYAMQQITELADMSLICAAAPSGIQNDWAVMVGDNGVTRDAITCPTLIIHDRADPLVPFIHAEWSRSCIPESRLLEVHAGGHLIWFGKDFELMHAERVAFIRKS